jgi:hypothetical protein
MPNLFFSNPASSDLSDIFHAMVLYRHYICTLLRNISFKTADFYNWNKVKVRYCDGGSFSAKVEDEFQVSRTFCKLILSS